MNTETYELIVVVLAFGALFGCVIIAFLTPPP
jgi:hypothetical protein